MSKLRRVQQRGDTIIEVLLAVAVFSLVAVGAIVVMNQGTNSSVRALEVTLVKQQVDSQAEALRAAQQDYFVSKSNGKALTGPAKDWNDIQSKLGTGGPEKNDQQCPKDSKTLTGTFAMDAATATIIDNPSLITAKGAPPYAKVVSSPSPAKAYGIWITKKSVSGSFNPKAYDFTIHACWYAPGIQVPMQVQTIVRLYYNDAP